MTTTAPWSELVTAALVGTERRTPPGGSPEALLDAAAVEAVRRRAGLRPGPAGPRPEPVADDPRPPLPPAARDRLAMLLAKRAEDGARGGRPGAAVPDLGELLPQWLALANRHGYRAPAHLVPALLDAARARTDLRAEALTFAGPRGRWLARLNPTWRFALRAVAGDAGVAGADGRPRGEAADAAGPMDEAAWERVRKEWQEGLFAERAALLLRVRRREPAAARELVESTWSTERAEDRVAFLQTLREGLSEADEPLLERALGDRSRTVRTTAAELLSTLPGSAFAARMADRARACLVPAGEGDRRWIDVRPPAECDAGMQRDGIPAKPAGGRGERSWWLSHILQAAPLSLWREHLGDGTASPAHLVALPVAEGWQVEVHAAWGRAAVRQRDAAWARALLGEPGERGDGEAGDPAKLLTVLPAEERARWVARFVAAHGLTEAFRMLAVCAVPWSAELGRAVIDALEIARDSGGYPWSFSGVMGLAERCLDPREADRLAPLATVTEGEDVEEAEHDARSTQGYWAEAFRRVVGTLRLRAVMQRELAGDADVTVP